jgi:hypothetical protein
LGEHELREQQRKFIEGEMSKKISGDKPAFTRGSDVPGLSLLPLVLYIFPRTSKMVCFQRVEGRTEGKKKEPANNNKVGQLYVLSLI